MAVPVWNDGSRNTALQSRGIGGGNRVFPGLVALDAPLRGGRVVRPVKSRNFTEENGEGAEAGFSGKKVFLARKGSER